MRAARLYAFSVFVGYAVMILLARGTDRGLVMHRIVSSALGYLSWVVGALATLGAARTLARATQRDALEALALQRGVAASSFERAHVLATALRITRLIALPVLLLIAIAAARGARLPWAASAALLSIGYAGSLGLCLAALALFAAHGSPRWPRVLLAALVLVPLFAAQAFPSVPSVPGLFAQLLRQLLASSERFA